MRARVAILIGLLLSTLATSAWAEKLKIAIPQRGFWNSSFVDFGLREGFFQKEGLDVEVFWTQGGSETVQAAVSGSVDIALATGTLGAVSAYFKNAPIRVISS